MANELDEYLTTPDALRQTCDAEGRLLKPGDVVSGLRVVAFLGRGATSEVWRVHDDALNRDLALKILVKTDDAVIRERFLSEARLLAQFDHPNLVRVHSFGETDGHPWFTMDALRPMPERPSRRLVRHVLDDVLDGLEFLHGKGIVHRDVKPSNVLLDAAGRAILTDLGIAHLDNDELSGKVQSAASHNLTLSEGRAAAIGTPGFGAPEQFAGGDVSPATDIHALGALLLSLFGGEPPLLWRGLIRRMTSSSVALRLKSVNETRARLRLITLVKAAMAAALAAIAGLAAWGIYLSCRIEWRELPTECVQRFADRSEIAITIPDAGHYVLASLKLSPVLSEDVEKVGPEIREMPDGTVDIAYPLEVLRKDSSWQRRKVTISGCGTLKCPAITCAEVHINDSATLVTSGRYQPDGDLIRSVAPPPSATFTNEIGYAAFVVAPAAKLVLTDNADYPPRLILRTNK